jgi:hypothetical protein
MLGRVCSGRSCVRGARVRRGCGAGAWAAAWVRGGGAWRRGWAAYVGRVPLAAAQAHVRVVRAGAWEAGRRGVFPQGGVEHAWALGLVRHPVALSGLLLRWQSSIRLLLCGGKVGCGNVPNLAYDQGGQELDTSAGGCRAGSLAGARFRPLPAPPRTLVCDPCSYSCRIGALPSSVYVQMHKKVCTILLYLNRSELIPPSKNLLRGVDFSACTRYYFDRKRKLVA